MDNISKNYLRSKNSIILPQSEYEMHPKSSKQSYLIEVHFHPLPCKLKIHFMLALEGSSTKQNPDRPTQSDRPVMFGKISLRIILE